MERIAQPITVAFMPLAVERNSTAAQGGELVATLDQMKKAQAVN
jgi:hypothetical protein